MLCLQFVAPSHTFPFFHCRPAEYGLQLGYDLGMGTIVCPGSSQWLEAVNLTSLCSAYQIYMCKKDNILRREEQMNQDEAVKSGAFPECNAWEASEHITFQHPRHGLEQNLLGRFQTLSCGRVSRITSPTDLRMGCQEKSRIIMNHPLFFG